MNGQILRPESNRNATQRSFDVLTVSDMCVDLILKGNVRPRFGQVEQIINDYWIEIGGSANIFISQIVKLGGKGGLIGYVGEDFFGEFLLRELNTIGVDTKLLKINSGGRTGLGVALTEETDRAILTYSGTIDATTPADLLLDLPAQTRHWHIASYFLLKSLRPFWKEWLSLCKNAGVSTSMDTNWDPEDTWDGIEDLLPLIDIFLPNEEEAVRITGEQDCAYAAEKLARVGNLVVIKRGVRGAIARRRTAIWEFNLPQQESLGVIDTIGAGDNFDAGFVWGQMLGWNVDASLELAHRCASASLSEAGGIRGQLRDASVANRS